ncbi:hypothetical protein CHRY9390_02463 [Chryseobacterium aquaeductus]|uniref:Uncharacterized protein n=1 Tax=Chryseobacterium aquaeductus TaxID=2675056 RepID=A0A9N8MPN3_9FLAO|nr:hypothetical protein [Chryseobacterium aquaeductus]CAA7331747.1 hypothetical protein CHRY9390_02463 [Chryseobacterium potabilaquae]CAD7812092.1 hypothetical protein CHRY9390_02463 [Chryseobacterium aquaeductus]
MRKAFAIISLLFIFSCDKKHDKTPAVATDNLKRSNERNDTKQDALSTEVALKKTNDELLQAIKVGYFDIFANYIHPQKGVRFSMYAFVNQNEDKHFTKTDFEKYLPTNTIFTWGSRDGSGEIYKATLNKYLNDWAFKKDFTKSEYSFNQFLGGGNSLNNLKEIYPKTYFTENYMKGSEQYGGIDWNALRFVFEEFDGKYYVVAVINDEWTI